MVLIEALTTIGQTIFMVITTILEYGYKWLVFLYQAFPHSREDAIFKLGIIIFLVLCLMIWLNYSI